VDQLFIAGNRRPQALRIRSDTITDIDDDEPGQEDQLLRSYCFPQQSVLSPEVDDGKLTTVIREMDAVERIITHAVQKSKDGRISVTDFLNEAAASMRYVTFTPMEVS
jgi:hypothetical protein